MMKKNESNEIDILDLVLLLWKEKFKFLFIVFLFIFGSILYQFIQPKPIHIKILSTDIIPITTFDEVKYKTYNSYINKVKQQNIKNSQKKKLNLHDSEEFIRGKFDINQINKEFLLELFINQLKKVDFVSTIVKKSELIKEKNYENAQAYENAVRNLVYSIKLISPVYENTGELKPNSNWLIQFETRDNIAWRNFLKLLNKSANIETQKLIYDNFKTFKEINEKLIQYSIEDIEIEISIALDKHKKKMINRIAFLREQSAIARELNISKTNLSSNTLESQTFSTESGKIMNLKIETPYFMRGYEMIEKEIELIENRKYQNAFNNELIELEAKRNLLLENRNNQRLQSLLEDTPIFNSNEFLAGKIMFETTKYKSNEPRGNSAIKVTFLFGVIGTIFAIFFIIIFAAIQKRKKISYRK